MGEDALRMILLGPGGATALDDLLTTCGDPAVEVPPAGGTPWPPVGSPFTDVGDDHPFVGETKIVGMMASLALTADKSVRKPFEAPAGSDAVLAVSGLLVGIGTRIGNGCTSGHGICGMSRLSPRSVAASHRDRRCGRRCRRM